MKLKLLFVVLLTTCFGCTESQRAKIGGLGERHRVTLWSGGIAVRTWVSPGKVSSSESSDGYYFRDEDTGLLVEISGDVVIERIEE